MLLGVARARDDRLYSAIRPLAQGDLRRHYRRQLEHRLMLGRGRPDADDLVFTRADGSPYPPDKLSRD